MHCGVCQEKPLEENLLSCPSKREVVEIILYAIFNDFDQLLITELGHMNRLTVSYSLSPEIYIFRNC